MAVSWVQGFAGFMTMRKVRSATAVLMMARADASLAAPVTLSAGRCRNTVTLNEAYVPW